MAKQCNRKPKAFEWTPGLTVEPTAPEFGTRIGLVDDEPVTPQFGARIGIVQDEPTAPNCAVRVGFGEDEVPTAPEFGTRIGITDQPAAPDFVPESWLTEQLVAA